MTHQDEVGRMLLRAIDRWSEGLILTDGEGEVLYANAEVMAMLGAEPGFATQRELLREAISQRTGKLRVIREDGSEAVLEVTAQAIDQLGETTYLLAFRDLSTALREILTLTALSHSDSLTGLLNRRGFVVEAENRLRDPSSRGRGVGVIMVDVDQLKAINDSYGHAEGDRALQQIAAVMRSTLRSSDVVARTGGDEFHALVVGIEPPALEDLAARLAARTRMAMPLYELSASVGYTSMSIATSETLDELLERADRSMYRHKASGT